MSDSRIRFAMSFRIPCGITILCPSFDVIQTEDCWSTCTDLIVQGPVVPYS